MRLYLCDDNPAHRVLYREALAPEPDLEVVGAGADLDTVAAELTALGPDVVLLDVSMPGTDGFAALPLLRRAAPDALIIMFSTAWSAANEERALALGASAYVQKPRDIFDLPALVRGAAGDASALVQHLVERWLAGDVDRAVAALHHQVEFVSPSYGSVRGVDAMRRVAGTLPPGVKAATVRPVELIERGSDVVLLARAVVTRAGPAGDVVEHTTPGWLMTSCHGKLTRIKGYPSWDDARGAAGLDGEPGPVKQRRLGPAGTWALAVALRPGRGPALA